MSFKILFLILNFIWYIYAFTFRVDNLANWLKGLHHEEKLETTDSSNQSILNQKKFYSYTVNDATQYLIC